MLVFALSLAIGKTLRDLAARTRGRSRPEPSPGAVVAHYYGQMLRALRAQGLARAPQQTPFEFLRVAEARALRCQSDIRLITDLFCASRYGDQHLTERERAAIAQALARIQQKPAATN